jgi:hypothetical protein
MHSSDNDSDCNCEFYDGDCGAWIVTHRTLSTCESQNEYGTRSAFTSYPRH